MIQRTRRLLGEPSQDFPNVFSVKIHPGFYGQAKLVLFEENGVPVAPAILGVVLGTMMEENFVTSMIKSDGDPLVFFTRPIAMWLAISTIVILLWPVGTWAYDRIKNGTAPKPSH